MPKQRQGEKNELFEQDPVLVVELGHQSGEANLPEAVADVHCVPDAPTTRVQGSGLKEAAAQGRGAVA